MPGETLIICAGNRFRKDDGAGPAVGDVLRNAGLPGVTIVEESGEGARLMEAWKGRDIVILVDAVKSGAVPGSIHRIDAAKQSVPTGFFSYSSHEFGVAEAVEMSRIFGELPPVFIIYGIEGADFGQGTGLSPDVARGVDDVAAMIKKVLK